MYLLHSYQVDHITAIVPRQDLVAYTSSVRLPSSTSDSIRATHQIIIMCNHEISTFRVPCRGKQSVHVADSNMRYAYAAGCLRNTHTPCAAAHRIEFLNSTSCNPLLAGCRPNRIPNKNGRKHTKHICKAKRKRTVTTTSIKSQQIPVRRSQFAISFSEREGREINAWLTFMELLQNSQNSTASIAGKSPATGKNKFSKLMT